ncbi:helix-turn-helix domain-containing protein [Rhodoferax sp. WC2427]|uniref:helix-turn-helix domain-containing protein n=1 Tax=Rhodoferax sp. WC2427 TaxID=3234144 RepID=UPI00346557AA
MGLTQLMLAKLCGLSRATVNQVESGTIKDLSMARASRLLEALGLSLVIAPPRPRGRSSGPASSRALEIAARTASVSYRTSMDAAQLKAVLVDAAQISSVQPHLHALLDEAPVSLLASVVEQLHAEEGVERACLWQRMRELAHQLMSTRALWQ